eukprot:TRINITY_DN16176_c0_g1_i1.p2 TRINITY_DN16176_c0_g1~~TRINITY_DN16176_c0_g1_i1.p2  ORF type:complete len:103 (-),score=31.13 TRINITY_DN16176_c0_g1_i1:44-352(-)
MGTEAVVSTQSTGVPMSSTEELLKQFKHFFDKIYDQNHDGIVDAEEVARALKAMDGDCGAATDEEWLEAARSWIRTYDTNGDGRLTWEEFKENFIKIHNHCY